MTLKLTSLILLMSCPVLLFGAVDANGYQRMDTDGDGKVSHKEFAQSRMKNFVRQDKDRDQFLDQSEAPTPYFLKTADTDGDGKVSFKEAVAFNFKTAIRMDKDGDGFLSMEELNPSSK